MEARSVPGCLEAVAAAIGYVAAAGGNDGRVAEVRCAEAGVAHFAIILEPGKHIGREHDILVDEYCRASWDVRLSKDAEGANVIGLLRW